MGAYGHIPTISLLLAFHYVAMNVRNDGLGVHDCRMSVYGKFGLTQTVRHVSRKGGSTHVKDMKDPVEVQPPGGDVVFVVLRVEKARDGTSFA